MKTQSDQILLLLSSIEGLLVILYNQCPNVQAEVNTIMNEIVTIYKKVEYYKKDIT